MSHPSDQSLYLREPDAVSHLASCKDCRARALRLEAGAALMAEARKQTSTELNWARVDSAVIEAAQVAAREAALAPKLRRTPWVAIGGAVLAMAAAAVFVLKVAKGPAESGGTAVVRVASSGGSLQPEAGARVEPALRAEASVLLLAGVVSHVVSQGQVESLRSDSLLREGSSVRTETTASRVVLSTTAGQRVDARGDSELRLARVSVRGSAVALVAGEARVDSQDEARVSLDVHQWRVSAKHGSFVAKIEGESVRLSVLSGDVGVGHDGAREERLEAGQVFLLGKHGERQRVEGTATDTNAVDDAVLQAGGDAVRVPAVADVASLQIEGGSMLPSEVTSLRVRRALRLLARDTAGAEFALELDPRRAEAAALQWRRTTAEGQARDPATTVATRDVALHARPARRVALTAETVPADARVGFRAVQRSLGSRARHCFDACDRTSSCGDASAIAPVVELDAEGRVSAVRMEGHGSEGLNQCIEREVRVMRLPLLSGQRINLGRFAR